MRHKPLGMIASCLALSCAATFASTLETNPDKQEAFSLALRGVHFVPNHGQWADAGVHFGLRSLGLDVAFRESALTMHLVRQAGSESHDREDAQAPNLDTLLTDDRDSLGDRAKYEHLTLTVSFPGSNDVVPEGDMPQTAKSNYFVGGEERGVATDVPSFGAVIYENLYDGIDLHVMGSDDGVMKYEFHVEPGADYGRIRIAYDGIESLRIDDGGNLQIKTSFGTLADGAPVVWQENARSRDTIAARFELCDDHTYRIAVDGLVDPTSVLIIDPDVEWMTYLGGSDDDECYGIAVDGAGNALVTGHTLSPDFEGRNNAFYGGDYDTFVAKVSASGTLQWMTYLGGSAFDHGREIAADSAGDALVTGYTNSPDFEGRNNTFHGYSYDTFVAKVSASGTLQWMTYLGGARVDHGFGIAADSAGNAMVTGRTDSTDFDGRNNSHHGGQFDVFVVKVSPSGTLQWMTYLGGSSGTDDGFGIAVDSAGNAMVTGITSSTDFEGRNNSHHGGPLDTFVVKVSPSGSLQWMTYLGGSSDYDNGYGIAADSAGNALVTGRTRSTDFEGRNNSHHGGQFDAFVVKVSPSGSLQWMTYLGGSSDNDDGFGIAADSAGNALVTGRTDSTDFEGRVNLHHGGQFDAFVVEVSASGVLQWMTYLGGSGFRDSGYDIAVDSVGNALAAGNAESHDFEGRNNSHHGGVVDAFLVKLRIADGPRLSVTATCPSGGPIQVSWSGASGGGTVALLYARTTGSFRIPNGNRCAGTLLGLGSNQIQIAYQGSGGQSGSRTVNSNAGPGACGGYLQLIDTPTCGTSNVARIE